MNSYHEENLDTHSTRTDLLLGWLGSRSSSRCNASINYRMEELVGEAHLGSAVETQSKKEREQAWDTLTRP